MRLILTSVCIVLTLTCLISMMAVFLGAQSPVLGTVLLIQGAATPFVLAIHLYYTWLSITRVGLSDLLVLYRRVVTGWMWLVFWSINSLAIASELSFQLVRWASGQRSPWLEHAPLWCAAACTFAVLAMFMWGQVRHTEVD